MKNFKWLLIFFLLSTLLASPLASSVEGVTSPGKSSSSSLKTGKKTDKVSQDLCSLYSEYAIYPDTISAPEFRSKNVRMLVRKGFVAIEAQAAGDPNLLLADLEKLGLKEATIWGIYVGGLLPIKAIEKINALENLKFVHPSYPAQKSGSVTTQGDIAINALSARSSFSVNGSGVTIGVISDSYNCLGGAAADIASGDLPPDVGLLKDYCDGGGSDEGRAMLQILHDVAPGAQLLFHTAYPTSQHMAQAILALANAGADIIVDDISFLSAPFFQDSDVGIAVDEVTTRGVLYFSSAGNMSRNSYEGVFAPTTTTLNGTTLVVHDFDPGPAEQPLQRLTILPATSEGDLFTLTFQWDSPYPTTATAGSANDLDILLLDENKELVAVSQANNLGTTPFEVINFFNRSGGSTFYLMIRHFEGPLPGLLKYILWNPSKIEEYATESPTLFGHANAAGAMAVGAVGYLQTPVWGSMQPLLESFSSAGGTPILFDKAGNRLSGADIRQKPEIVAPDNADTTFFISGWDPDGSGYPNFLGTSAAAPHAAAVAALLLEAAPAASPQAIFAALRDTAIDMNAAGFDFDSGDGLIHAKQALAAATRPIPDIEISATTLDFGSVQTGTSRKIQLVVANRGNVDLGIGAVAAGNPLTLPFSIAADHCSDSILLPAAQCTIEVLFAPLAAPFPADSFDIPSDDPDESSLQVNVQGMETAQLVPDITVTPTSSFLRKVVVETAQGEVVTITNSGSGDLLIGQIGQDDSLAPPFTLADDGCSAVTLPPGQSCTLRVDFRPLNAGIFQDSFNIPSNDPDTQVVSVTLSGQGAASCSPSTPTLVSPLRGEEKSATSVTFRWKACTAPYAEDLVYYELYYSQDPNFTNVLPLIWKSPNDLEPISLKTSVGFVALCFALLLPSALRRKKYLVVFLPLALSLSLSIFFTACSSGGGQSDGNSDTAPAPPADEIAVTVNNLQKATTYYWKVRACDKDESASESVVNSFSTLP